MQTNSNLMHSNHCVHSTSINCRVRLCTMWDGNFWEMQSILFLAHRLLHKHQDKLDGTTAPLQFKPVVLEGFEKQGGMVPMEKVRISRGRTNNRSFLTRASACHCEAPCQPHWAQSIPYTIYTPQDVVGLGPRTSVSWELVLQLEILWP